ncbi:MAG: tRNA (guanine-N1)-methyltransferase [Pleurocapsa sp.]
MTNEGKAQFKVGKAFYNPQTKLVRDLGILVAIAYKQEHHSLRILDALGGCGVRSLRYWLESNADYIWLNEGNRELHSLLRDNLQPAIAAKCCQITHIDAHRLFFDRYSYRDYYDLVDVDCFGCAAPYLSTMLWATKIGGLMYLTSTDGRTLTGNLPNNSLQAYGAIARSHPAAHEQGLRLIIGSVLQQAATKGLGIEPIFSYFTGKTYRLMLRLLPKPNLNLKNYGWLAYCHHCGNYQTVSARQLNKVNCSCDRYAPRLRRDRPTIILSGAMWLDKLHHPQQLEGLIAIARQLQWQEASELLTVMAAEAELPPYFYTLGEIGNKGKMDLPKRSQLIIALQNKGYQATVTHINPQAIKTNADIHTCIAIAKSLNSINCKT